jgi:hypothetical protein
MLGLLRGVDDRSSSHHIQHPSSHHHTSGHMDMVEPGGQPRGTTAELLMFFSSIKKNILPSQAMHVGHKSVTVESLEYLQ